MTEALWIGSLVLAFVVGHLTGAARAYDSGVKAGRYLQQRFRNGL